MAKISENALNALAACEYRGIGRGWAARRIRGGESAEDMAAMIAEKDGSATVRGFRELRERIRGEIARLGDAIDGVTGISDEDFPAIPPGVKPGDMPVAVFYKGDLGLIRRGAGNVAVIGLLEPSAKILERERAVVRELIRAGKCIVSGLARGCDAAGHREALESGGKTVAFLAGPLTEINPPCNRGLAAEILEKGGLLAAEYWRKPSTRREFVGRYIERDRLQAMFSSAVVLAGSYSEEDTRADAGKDSGSRHAMAKARAYGIPRYVIYDGAEDGGDAMHNLSREEMRAGAQAIMPGRMPSFGEAVQGELALGWE